MSEIIGSYFPDISDDQAEKFSRLKKIYDNWNSKINVISRKDMDNFYVRHVLHSLSIAKIISFREGTRILDAGTGGGFPGIPLAVLFPGSTFTLLDSIGKKIKVVSAVVEELKLTNIIAVRKRIEDEKNKYDFIVSRAVTDFESFVKLTLKNIDTASANTLKNGIIYLRGGTLTDERELFGNRLKVWNIADFFKEPFFETKKIVYFSS